MVAISKVLQGIILKLRCHVHGGAMIVALAGLSSLACQRERDVDVLLPYEQQIAVEAYLEAGKLTPLAITYSTSYFDTVAVPNLRDCLVILSQGDRKDTCYYRLFDDEYAKASNYLSNLPAVFDVAQPYQLRVTHPQLGSVSGQAQFLPPVEISRAEVLPQPDGRTRIRVQIKDNPGTTDYYRVVVSDAINIKNVSIYDALLADPLNPDYNVTTGSFVEIGKMAVRVYHIEQPYYDFLLTSRLQRLSLGNPFAATGPIKHTIANGVGVFAALSLSADTVLVQ
jgi:hypothetical protein